MTRPAANDDAGIERVAIIGMACRMPGAQNVDEFWANLCASVESIRPFSADELIASGVDPAVLREPGYVNAGAPLDDADCFDAAFFGYMPKEAEQTDPQQRVLLECAWLALENAGYDPERFAGRIGVFAGVARNTYLINNIATHAELVNPNGLSQMWLGNDKDFVATRISHKLNLRGPGINVQSACSTSGVAAHLACQSLLLGESDMALIGGARIQVPLKSGYPFQEGGIFSPDGHCRAFDADANGTIIGNGAAMLVLKRLSDARRDGDCIYALIRGSAINNDGSAKVGFTAPSVSGQAAVIAEALAVAETDAESISYIETHGTATRLGDPIEIAALTKAFRSSTSKKNFCAIGSVKTNIGHLDAGAGAAGLIKTALALKHKRLPPSLHYKKPNPQIDFASSPFYVNTKLTVWPASKGARRAGVSSFGLGGTNAHLILEETADSDEEPSSSTRPAQLLTLSARSATALEKTAENLAQHLKSAPSLSLADAAYTLQVGRRAFSHRRAIVCGHAKDALHALEMREKQSTTPAGSTSPDLIFMFPGGGAQYPDMGRELYEHEPVFHDAIDQCLSFLKSQLKLDLRAILFPATTDLFAAAREMERPSVGLPILFAVEYGIAKLWTTWGLRPSALIGHSMGEYTAACLAGSLNLQDALRLVTKRGQLFETLPPGAMISVPLPDNEIRTLVGADLSVAALNSPASCVVAGPVDAIASFEQTLSTRGIESVRLKIAVAAHSIMLDPILDEFAAFVKEIPLAAPAIPFISNVTGTWISPAEINDPLYLVRHLRNCVRFSEGMVELLKKENQIFVETGPGRTLSTLAFQHPQMDKSQAMPSLRHPKDTQPDCAFILNTLGRLWTSGAKVEWDKYHASERRRRVPLPGYPFERKRFWVDPLHPARGVQHVKNVNTSQSESEIQEIPAAMVESPSSSIQQSSGSRKARIADALQNILHGLSGIEIDALNTSASFFELGFDSLFLTRATQAMEREFGVRVRFRQLAEELPTIDALAAYLDQKMPAGKFDEPQTETPAPASVTTQNARVERKSTSNGVSQNSAVVPTVKGSSLERIIAQQMELMTQQLALLRGDGSVAVSAIQPERLPAPAPSTETKMDTSAPKTHGPYAPLARGRENELSERQRKHLNELIARYTRRTPQSKQFTQRNRAKLADPRAISGFRALWKEMVYPTVAKRTAGSKMWDIDGNEYIDLVMGYGINLFGHSPDFITQAMYEQMKSGYPIGPQSVLTGQIAELFCEMTGAERISFCNTGSEAVLAAMRVARTVTGRPKIAIFADSYHGLFDEVLVRANTIKGVQSAVPVAPGIPQHSGQEILILDYGTPQALQILKNNAHDIAAVLVEPVQSKHPDFQPRAFIHELRQLTAESGIALVFDEMITGFRAHLRGAQGHFGVQADLAAYGKVIGGGMPIGILAGKSTYMDALDGGPWNYGDSSAPEANLTYFAGTFVRHPLALASTYAALKHLKESGPGLQDALNAKTTQIAQTLNSHFEHRHAPLKVLHFSSVFKLLIPPEFPLANLLFFHLREKGIDTWERRNCFLSTAHSVQDIQKVVQAYMDSVDEMQEGGFLPGGLDETQKKSHRSESRPVVEGSGSVLKPSPSAENAILPLTEGQREIWLASQMSREASCSYNEICVLQLGGALDLDALRSSLQQLSRRHDALRCIFSRSGDYQTMRETCDVQAEFIDLGSLTENEKRRRVDAILESEGQTPFDLEHGPLWRVRILKHSETQHTLVLAFHHIVADGWSIGVLLEELSTVYSAQTTQQMSRLIEPMQFSEYVRLETSRKNENLADEEFWLEQYSVPPEVLNLPADRPRPAQKTYGAAQIRKTLSPSALDGIKQFGAKHRCTQFVTLLTAFDVLIHRLSGQDDIVVGVPAAGQSRAGERPLVGHCVSMLPMRSRLGETVTLAEFAEQTRTGMLDAFDHQSITFGALIPKLKLARDNSRTPLVEVTFNFEKAESAKFGGLETHVRPGSKTFFNFDLFLNVRQTASAMELVCTFNPDLFDAKTIERWMEHYECILTALQTGSQSAVAQVPLVDAQTEKMLLEVWGKTDKTFGDASMAHQMFERQVMRSPDSVALVQGNRSLSYGELNRRANQLAHVLLKKGAAPERLIAICAERSIENVIGLLAILKSGGAYVPLDPAYPAERLSVMLADARPLALLTNRDQASRFSYNGTLLLLDDVQLLEKESIENPEPRCKPENLAYVIYTSGSTGKPKGVQIEHAGLTNLIHWHLDAYGLSAADRTTLLAGPAFDASAWELWPALASGASIYIPADSERQSAQQLLAWMADQKITQSFMPTPLAEAVLDSSPPAELCLRVLLTGGDALRRRPDGRHAFKLFNHYGPTENCVVSTCAQVQKLDGTVQPKIGRPIPNTRVYVLDKFMHPLPVGIAGELYVGGAGLARGYLNLPQLTAKHFVQDPFCIDRSARMYRTGDLVRWLPDGNLEFIGRRDKQVKVRGFRIELGELETALIEHTSVQQAIATVREDATGNKRLLAFAVLKQGLRISASDLRGFILKKLPDYMVPARIIILDTLPLTPNGKVDSAALTEPLLEIDTSSQIPNTETERELMRIWSEVLNLKSVGTHQNFFELGGHSLLAGQIISRVRERFKTEMPLRAMFEKPTIAQLAAELDSLQVRATTMTPIPMTPAGLASKTAPLSYAQQRLWFMEQLQPGSSAMNVCCALRLSGTLNVDALERAFNEVVRRHDILRTSFKATDGVPTQEISDAFEIHLSEIDLRERNTDAQLVELRKIAANLTTPFDLTRLPLFRIRLARTAEREFILIWATHHIIFDGWSLNVLLRDVLQLHAAYAENRQPQLPALPIQYADFARWQRGQSETLLHEQLAYWKRQLRAPMPHTTLPGDKPRSHTQSFRGGRHTCTVPTALVHALKELCRCRNVTLNMALLGAFKVLLHHYTQAPEIVVGSPVAGRGRPELEPLIGFFINTLVLRTDLSGDPSFVNLIERVREVMLDSMANQDVPFERIVRELSPERENNQSPLFQILFNMVSTGSDGIECGGIRATEISLLETGSAKFDLTLYVHERDSELSLDAVYNAELYAQETIVTLLNRLTTLLKNATRDPELSISKLLAADDVFLDQSLDAFNEDIKTPQEPARPESANTVTLS